MNKIVLLTCFLTVCLSCNNNKIEKPEKPDNLIPKNQMVEVLYDMALVSSAKGVNRKLLESKGIVPDQFIYSKHDIDSIQFAQSNAYYAYDIKEYSEIYSQVRAKLERDKENLRTLNEQEKKQRDSITKSKAANRRAAKDSLIKNDESPSLLKTDGTSPQLIDQ